MKRKMLGAVFGAVLTVGLLSATPASARSDPTITVTCSGGQVIVSDANSTGGQTTANTAYNAVNPFGEVCVVHP